MRSPSHKSSKAILIVLGLSSLRFGVAAVIVPAFAESGDPIVTSDTPEYCDVLMGRISGITRATAAPPPSEVDVLSREGVRMCVHGQTRGGILRLRRALELMRHGDE